MPQRDTTVVGAPCWVDLFTSDPDGARSFYTALFGWGTTEPSAEFGGYTNFTKDGQLVAGCMGSTPEDAVTDVWSVYLATDDARATTDAAVAHGAQVVVPPMPVGDLGTMAVVTDPTGATVGLWQAGAHLGTAVVAEPGAPAWFELRTDDHDAAVAFYTAAFGWKTQAVSEAPEFRYTIALGPTDPVAGVQGVDAPSRWGVYVAVDLCDTTAARAVELGGRVIDPPADGPDGRHARIADPTGAELFLHSPLEGW